MDVSTEEPLSMRDLISSLKIKSEEDGVLRTLQLGSLKEEIEALLEKYEKIETERKKLVGLNSQLESRLEAKDKEINGLRNLAESFVLYADAEDDDVMQGISNISLTTTTKSQKSKRILRRKKDEEKEEQKTEEENNHNNNNFELDFCEGVHNAPPPGFSEIAAMQKRRTDWMNAKGKHSLNFAIGRGNLTQSQTDEKQCGCKVRIQLEKLEAEVEQWMHASEEIQKLGEEAVLEVMSENEALKSELKEVLQRHENEKQRRKAVEAELMETNAKLNELSDVFNRLMVMGENGTL